MSAQSSASVLHLPVEIPCRSTQSERLKRARNFRLRCETDPVVQSSPEVDANLRCPVEAGRIWPRIADPLADYQAVHQLLWPDQKTPISVGGTMLQCAGAIPASNSTPRRIIHHWCPHSPTIQITNGAEICREGLLPPCWANCRFTDNPLIKPFTVSGNGSTDCRVLHADWIIHPCTMAYIRLHAFSTILRADTTPWHRITQGICVELLVNKISL